MWWNYVLNIADNKIKSNDLENTFKIIKNFVGKYKIKFTDFELGKVEDINDYDDFVNLLEFYDL